MVHKIQNTNTKQDLERIKSFLKTNDAVTASICHLRIDDVKVATKLCKRKLFQKLFQSKRIFTLGQCPIKLNPLPPNYTNRPPRWCSALMAKKYQRVKYWLKVRNAFTNKKLLFFWILSKWGGGALPNFFVTLSLVHFWSIKGIFFLQNANNLKFKLFF